MAAKPEMEDECMGASPEARNAIYAAKLKNARARNLGAEWEENAKIIEEAEKAAADCENVRAKILAETLVIRWMIVQMPPCPLLLHLTSVDISSSVAITFGVSRARIRFTATRSCGR